MSCIPDRVSRLVAPATVHHAKPHAWIRRWSLTASLAFITAAMLPIAPGTAGSEFFVTINGSPSGDGTAGRPWDLQTALNHPGTVTPGSTIWVRGGLYRGRFTSWLTGTASAPIIVRNYAGERVTIDNVTDCSTYVINGNYSWHWGLEITSSGTIRRTPHAESDCGNTSLTVHLDRGLGFRNNGAYTRLINNIVHDTQNGVSNWGTWTSGPGLEVYGNLIYYNGWEQTPIGRGHGHGTYTLSKSNGATRLVDNIFHTQFSQGIRMGDEGVFNPHIEGNISYLNGEHMTPMGGRNLYVGGGNNYDYDRAAYVPMSGAVIRSNYTYYRTNTTGVSPGNAGASEGLNAGLWWPGASGEIVGNYLAGLSGGHILQLGYWDQFTATTCSGNTMYGTTNDYARAQCRTGSNTYYTSRPPTNAVFVRPNQYEAGRAHIAIFNWQNLSVVTVDISRSGLRDGQAFEVRDAMNFYGPPVASGTYASGAASVVIPMTGLTRAPMAGEQDVTSAYRPKPHSAPEFGAFIVLPTGSSGGSTPPPPSTCSTVNTGSFAACYYDDTTLTTLALTRTDNVIDFDWGAGSPAPAIDADTFSARWQGLFTFEAAQYDFVTTVDNGVRLYVDDVLIHDRWQDDELNVNTVRRALTAGQHKIRMEYYEQGGDAVARLHWAKVGATAPPTAAVPGAPVSLSAKTVARRTTLTWGAPTAGGVPTAYQVEAGSSPGATTTVIPVGLTTSAVISDLPKGTTYIRVRALNAAGVGPPSNEVSVRVR